MTFEISKEDQIKIKEWLENEIEPSILAKQKIEYKDDKFIQD